MKEDEDTQSKAVTAIFSSTIKHSSLRMTQLHWLEVSEYAGLSLSTIGIVTAAVTQQIVYAVAPLTLTLGLNIANRERLKYLNQQHHARTLTRLDLLIDPLRQRLENFDAFTQKQTTTTQQQFEQLRNSQQLSTDVFSQRLTKLDALTQQLGITVQQQIQELQRNQEEQNVDAFSQHLTQLDALTEQLSTNTQQQIDPLNQRLTQIDALTQQLSKTTQQQIEELQRNQQDYKIEDFRQRLTQLDALTQQLSTSTQKQIEPLSQRLTQLDALTQQLSKTTQQQIQELQRHQQEYNIDDLRQRLTQLDVLTRKLNINTQKHIEELKSAVTEIQTELQVLTLSLTLAEQDSFDASQRIRNREDLKPQQPQTTSQQELIGGEPSRASQSLAPVSPQAQQINAAQNTSPVIVNKDSNPQQPQATAQYTSSTPLDSKERHDGTRFKSQETSGSVPDVVQSGVGNPQQALAPQAGELAVGADSKSLQPVTPQKPQTTSSQNTSPNEVKKDSNPQVDDKTTKVFTPVIATPASQSTKHNLIFIRTLKGHSDKVMSVAFSPDGRTLASGSNDKTIKIWNLASNEPRTFTGYEVSDNSGGVNSVAFSPNGKQIASGCDDKTIKLWDVQTGKEICTFTGHENKVYSIAFSPDGKTLASGSKDKTIKLWSIERYKGIYTIPGHADEVLCVAFSPDGKILASSGALNDKTIKIWYLSENKFLTLKGHSGLFGGINSIAFSPDGKTLASGSTDNTIKIWQMSSGKELRTLTGHSDQVCSVAFSPDGKTLASGSKDKMIKLWQVDTGNELRTFTGNEEPIYCVAFSPDGKTLASGNGDKTITLLPFD